LIEAGANPNRPNGSTNALMMYLRENTRLCTEIVKLLVDAGADINQLDMYGHNGLQILFRTKTSKVADIKPFLETADIMIAAGIDVQNKNCHKKNVLFTLFNSSAGELS
jgi:hypothetical protein